MASIARGASRHELADVMLAFALVQYRESTPPSYTDALHRSGLFTPMRASNRRYRLPRPVFRAESGSGKQHLVRPRLSRALLRFLIRKYLCVLVCECSCCAHPVFESSVGHDPRRGEGTSLLGLLLDGLRRAIDAW